MSAKRITTVFFDFGGVFVDRVGPATFRYASRLAKVPIKAIEFHYMQNHVPHQIGKENLKTCWRRIFEEMGMRPKERLIRKIVGSYRSFAKPRPAVFRIARELKARGIRVGLISDTCEEHANVNFRRGFYKYFDPLILSHEVGLKKPGAKIFRLALRRASSKASQSLFIDDYSTNIEAARGVGLRAVRFENSRQLRRDLKKLRIL